MKKFIYTNNKHVFGVVLAEIEAETILEADEEFEKKTKLIPSRNPWIGCQILPCDSNN